MHARAALLLCAVSPVAGCGPSDGVLSYEFALERLRVLTLPAPEEIDGRRLDALDFAGAAGRCVGTPPVRRIEVRVDGLPPLGVPAAKARYRFVVAREGLPDGLEVATIVPDELGRATALADSSPMDSAVASGSSISGGHVEIVIPAGDKGEKTWRVLHGAPGNLSDPAAPAPAPSGGGHAH